MKAPVIESRFHHANPVADLNRDALRGEHVFTVSITGGPGCGKTTLIDATIQRLMPDVHVGVIACDVASRLDAERLSRHSEQVVQVNIGEHGALDASHIRDALRWLDLKWLDLLLVECIGTLVGVAPQDLGQDATAAVFSVAAGHDMAGKHPDVVRAAGVVLLNKVDLLPTVPFDLDVFRGEVQRLNPAAPPVMELSALRRDGLDAWLTWLRQGTHLASSHASNWFG